jgi:hypothetical protein
MDKLKEPFEKYSDGSANFIDVKINELNQQGSCGDIMLYIACR